MSILEMKGLSKYFGGLAALSDINLTIQEGEIRGIIGPEWCGLRPLSSTLSVGSTDPPQDRYSIGKASVSTGFPQAR